MRYHTYKDRLLNAGELCEVYRNLHRGGFSIRQRGLVVGHVVGDDLFYLRSPKPVVRSSGLERYYSTGVRNVHAWLLGEPYLHDDVTPSAWRLATYNPNFGCFIWPDGFSPAMAMFHGGKLYVI